MSIALQTAVEAIGKAIGPTPDDKQLITEAKCIGLMVGYDQRWRDAEWRTVSTEEVFQLPIVNPSTQRASRTFTQAGKFDGIVDYRGKNYLLEHKSTSDDISDPNGPYWRRLAIDSQVSSYVLANWQSGRKVDGTLYDVIRKPGIRPKEITKINRTLIVADGAYCGHKVTMETRTAVANGQDRECPELYRLRLAAETLAEPDKYFQRRVIPRLDGEVLEWADELWDVAQDINTARTKGRFYRNSDSCMNWGRPCEYLGICSGHDTPDSDKWKRKPQVHVELPVELPNRGLAVLTNSSVKTFQACRRKFQYRYDLGIERPDEEEIEALYLGTVLHAGLCSWFSCFPLLESSNDCPTGSAANEVAQPTDGSQVAG